MKRIPEPELMDSPEQVDAYAAADFEEGNRAFAARVAEALSGGRAGTLIDLGCGPGDICRRLAEALPDWTIEGLDAGPNMLRTAERDTADSPHADRIRYRLARLPDDALPPAGYRAVVSNSLLHHLPDPSALWRSIARLAAPGAYVQVMDLDRPDDEATARSLVDAYALDEPDVLREDFFNSLCAAWTAEEVTEQLAEAGLDLRVERISDRHWLVHGRISA
jgi:2-polyprenyl-3-methyl-5-hydroxy-6-metoxy-1,4-benzoquinol methylase